MVLSCAHCWKLSLRHSKTVVVNNNNDTNNQYNNDNNNKSILYSATIHSCDVERSEQIRLYQYTQSYMHSQTTQIGLLPTNGNTPSEMLTK